MLFEAFIEHRVLPEELTAEKPGLTASFLLEKAAALLRAVALAARSLDAAERARTLPAALELFTAPVPDSPGELAELLSECDRFRRSRVFRFLGGKFLPAEVDSAKPLDRFFGYPGVRSAFLDHFSKFAAGKTNLPLLVNSLPGHGKTSLTVSPRAGTARTGADPARTGGAGTGLVRTGRTARRPAGPPLRPLLRRHRSAPHRLVPVPHQRRRRLLAAGERHAGTFGQL
ncbi:MAG: hypothetical protein L6W00_10460 [Lentisphaeria bacterium]|nr:MAG: hypothetical protein L6W00_10460 [Lentisphaeria bacterium]